MNEPVQEGVASDGNGIVLVCAPFADIRRPTLAELTASSTYRITYGLTTDGFDHQTDIAKITTGRWMLKQALSKDGVITDTVIFRYVYNRETPTEVEEMLGIPGVDYDIVVINGYPNGHVIDEDTKINVIIPITTSISKDVPPTTNTELAKEMSPNIRGEVAREHEIQIVAGSGSGGSEG